MKLINYSSQIISQKQLENFSLTENQVIFSGLPMEAIEQSKAEKNRYPIFLIDKDKAPTFFVLHTEEGPKQYTDNPHAILLRSFSTDRKFQGKGYAKQALIRLPEFIYQNFSTVNEIILGVNSMNEAAIGLYKQAGFIDNGRPLKTEYGELRIMYQSI